MSRIPYYTYLISNYLFKIKIPILPQIFMIFNRIIWGAYIPPSCTIGVNCKFGYGGNGVVIHARAVLGSNCIINPGVTIGGKSKIYEVPIIGNNVYIGSGAKILGNVKVGSDVIIGPNSVVLEDVPTGSIAVGIPAKIIRKNIKMEDYV